jgi:hypothetical protein
MGDHHGKVPSIGILPLHPKEITIGIRISNLLPASMFQLELMISRCNSRTRIMNGVNF